MAEIALPTKAIQDDTNIRVKNIETKSNDISVKTADIQSKVTEIHSTNNLVPKSNKTGASSYQYTVLNITGKGVLESVSNLSVYSFSVSITLDGVTVFNGSYNTASTAILRSKFNSSCVIKTDQQDGVNNLAVFYNLA